MSEKGKQIEKEEREMFEHWSHEHPLSLVETCGGEYCYGCEDRFSSGEQAYKCSIGGCNYSNLLHEGCANTARKIRHPSHHPQHILVQQHEPDLCECDICERIIWSIGYKCTGAECEFEMHLRCSQSDGLINAVADDGVEQISDIIRHPSHPDHDMKLLRRRCTFDCDACGTTHAKGSSSYTCTADACQYWIHERCASLPHTMEREDHHHSLSLSFHVPLEYIIFDYRCDVCSRILLPKNWIYHCQICRYIVHIKCAFNKLPRIIENIGKDIIHLPVNEVAEELITPFVMRQRGGETLIPPIIIPAAATDELMKVKYKFIHHQHQLTLVSSGHQNQEEEDEENYGVRFELICDGCITPISSTSNTPSSSDSKHDYYYMSCSECKYNLHLACFHLPPQLSSLPIHLHDGHHLLLQSGDKLQPWEGQYCSVCEYDTNGLFYRCTACYFRVDIQCACMPDIIHHAAHPRHLLKHVTQSDLSRDINRRRLWCAAGCGKDIDDYDCYRCCSSIPCDFIVHVRCALLPVSVSSRRWDEHHPLLLTYNATLNRPGDFYCDQCETQMNPRSWMYHCRPCDISFHPKCFITTSGWLRNFKLGQEYANDTTHQHPLTYQLLTTKRRCDICGRDRHEEPGFYCAFCNFFICYRRCRTGLI